jgi:hypothetical protein
MARPMILMQRSLLEDLHTEYVRGVPIAKLKVKYSVNLTPPTLNKLIQHFDIAKSNETTNVVRHKVDGQKIATTVYNSLFPEWLNNSTETLVTQDSSWYYTGMFPFGEWKKRKWSN